MTCVEAGTLKAQVNGAVPAALCLNGGATINGNGLTHTLPRVEGAGTFENGTARVTGSVAPGTDEESAPGAILSFSNLTLGAGVTVECDTSDGGLPDGVNDKVAVAQKLAVEGPGFVDFGRTEANPLTMPYSANIMTYDTLSGSFVGWKAKGTGQLDGKLSLRMVLDESVNPKVVRAELVYGGFLLILQ